MTLSSAARILWGKSDREKNDGNWHPLLCHLLDVAAVAEAILEREPARTRSLYAQDFACSSYDEVLPWLLSFITLHDLGKASPSFQSLWPVGAERTQKAGLTWNKKPEYVPHGFITQYTLESENDYWPLQISREALELIGDAVGCHHGTRATGSDLDLNPRDIGKGIWCEVRRELVLWTLQHFGASLEQAPTLEQFSAGAFYRLAGLTSFADWIGSNPDFFPFEPNVADFAAYFKVAQARAQAALQLIGWHPRVPLMDELKSFEQIPFGELGDTFPARPLQQKVEQLLEGVNTPTLLLIEAPMGEGKTEAAFYAHLRLQTAVGHRGMYVALPTQATGNAMFKRTQLFLANLKRPNILDLQLLHGATLLSEAYAKLKFQAIDEGKIPQPDHNVRAHEWFTKKRALLSEYGVGTVDQSLLGVLPLKHNFVRLWGLGNRTVVIDEVHAYDAYTSSLIEYLVAWLHALGSSVVILSATLPRARRESLLKAYGAENLPILDAYPRVFQVTEGIAVGEAFEADPSRKVEIEILARSAALEDIAPELLSSVQQGGCAVCIVNTVQRAQDLHGLLEETARSQGIELLIFHARYPAHARQKREQAVLNRFGKEGVRPEKAILIGTQVLEQSLDLDFDVMFTDLAPVDLVLQRSGRLWRHKRSNRATSQTTPRLYVLGLDQTVEVPDFGKAPKLYWDVIYDSSILLRSYGILRNRSSLNLPEDIDPLVQKVYADAPLEGISETLAHAILEAEKQDRQKEGGNRALAAQSIIGLPQDGSWEHVPELEQYDPEDKPELHKHLQARTRLGEPTVTVIPLVRQADGRYTCGDKTFSLEGKPYWELAKTLYLHSVSLSNKSVVYALWKVERPESWQKNPLLRNCYPLELVEGRIQIGKTEVSLDEVLGIVYERL